MRRLVFVSLFLLSCGPIENPGIPGDGGASPTVDSGGAGGLPDAYFGPTARVTGRVWAPGQAPGMVPLGQEVPVFSALVTVSPGRQAPIPQETFCERCVNPSGKYVFTDHQGNFDLDIINPGNYWLTIQKGQFRVEQEVVMGPDQTLELAAQDSTLPSRNDPANGRWIPRIAMAVGSYDHLEDILGKMGLGSVSGSGDYVDTSAAGIMDVYTNGTSFGGGTQGTLTDLVGDLNRLLQYHILFIPCSTSTNTGALLNQQNLHNIRDFVDAGGKLYVTDWSGEWADNVFPAQMTLGANEDTPASAYNPTTDSWNTNQFGDADGSFYDSNNAEIIDPDLFDWLNGQAGPIVENYNTTVDYNPSQFTVEGNWNTIEALNQVVIGQDNEGLPIYDTPQAFIIGGRGTSTPKKPLTVTFEPTGCGRVLYSTYHTTDNTHNGLVPQERVLLYLIMEIGVCQSGPIID